MNMKKNFSGFEEYLIIDIMKNFYKTYWIFFANYIENNKDLLNENFQRKFLINCWKKFIFIVKDTFKLKFETIDCPTLKFNSSWNLEQSKPKHQKKQILEKRTKLKKERDKYIGKFSNGIIEKMFNITSKED